jgi:hypothetical protein
MNSRSLPFMPNVPSIVSSSFILLLSYKLVENTNYKIDIRPLKKEPALSRNVGRRLSSDEVKYPRITDNCSAQLYKLYSSHEAPHSAPLSSPLTLSSSQPHMFPSVHLWPVWLYHILPHHLTNRRVFANRKWT